VFGAAQGSVTIGGWQCSVSYWSTSQINCLVNGSMPTGSQNLTVFTNGVSPSISVTVF
jgi:uncharacterized protein (TIGR03437 family)